MDDEMFQEFLESMREAKAIMRGEMEPSRVFEIKEPDVKSIRAKNKLSERDFAIMMGISVKTLRDWEEGRRTPKGPARVLLMVAAKHPEAIWDSQRPVRVK